MLWSLTKHNTERTKEQETLLTTGSFILVDILDIVQYNKHMNKQTPHSQAADLKQAIHLLDQAAKLMYTLDIRLSDYNSVQATISSLEADLTDLLESGQL